MRLGLKLYRDGCSGCHGDAGNPSRWGMTGFYPRVPQFDAAHPHQPEWQLFWIVKHGVRYSGMGAWESLMSDEKIWAVVGFLSHLENLPPEVDADWRTRTGEIPIGETSPLSLKIPAIDLVEGLGSVLRLGHYQGL